MSMPLDAIEAEALKLPREERAALVERLTASMPVGLAFEHDWYAEVVRRDAEIDAGGATTVPLEEAMARVRRAGG